MHIIFLDIDGVLSSDQSDEYYYQATAGKAVWSSHECLCPIASSNLRYILNRVPTANIVISSTWRHFYEMEELRDVLWQKCAIPPSRILGRTGETLRTRGAEIQKWLNDNEDLNIRDFVIFDEHDDIGHFSETNEPIDSTIGLTIKTARRAIERFGRQWKE